jgi:dienelactone hydrolase
MKWILNLILILIIVVTVWYIWMKSHPQAVTDGIRKRASKVRKSMVKTNDALLGKRFAIEREGKPSVRMNLYEPDNVPEPWPVVFIAHGGDFLSGTADQIDTFCDRVRNEWKAMIVSIDYSFIQEHRFPYPQDEIIDTVLWFATHSNQMHCDPKRFALAGFTAGAHLAFGANALLKQKGFETRGILMVCPVVEDSLIRLVQTRIAAGPVMVFKASEDPGNINIDALIQTLRDNGYEVREQIYEGVDNGFMDMNDPEFRGSSYYRNSRSINDHAEEKAREAEADAGDVFARWFNSTYVD